MDLRYPQPVPLAAHPDHRGSHKKFFGATPESIVVPDFEVAEVFMTTNKLNAIRGMHFQVPGMPKLIQVLSGAVRGNILCCDPSLPEFGKAITFLAHEDSDVRFFIPGSWALGYRALRDESRVLYLAGAPFAPEGDVGIDPFDRTLGLNWRATDDDSFNAADAILSDRDKNLPSFEEFKASLEEEKGPKS